ncbi:MAG: GTP-binding protein [Chlamydiales bacterium]
MEEHKVNVAFVGHVDHGKSSILGRLLVDTHSLPDGKLEQLKSYCERHAKDFEYAFLTDALEKEQAQGITIDAARYFIRSEGRKYLFIDTPGHLDFIKNMITGSSTADIALLIIDAKEGIKDNTLRHLFLLSFLQIPKIVVVVNKMDQVDYSEPAYLAIAKAISTAFASHQITPHEILPLSAKQGDHFLGPSPNMPWYKGKSLWESIRSFSHVDKTRGPDLRMPLQAIYRFTKRGDSRRIYSGTVSAGILKKGDRLLFSPSGKEGVVASIESDVDPPRVGFATGFTLEESLFVDRGELISHSSAPPPLVGSQFKVRLFFIGRNPLLEGAKYIFRIHTSKTGCAIEKILAIYDSATLGSKQKAAAKAYDIVECVIRTVRPVAFDISPLYLDTTRFVLVDSCEILGAGVILE